MLNAIGVLSLLLLVSLSFNYSQFGKSKALSMIIDAQEAATEEMIKQSARAEAIKKLTDVTFTNVLVKTEDSDASFRKLSDSLLVTDCSKGKVNEKPQVNTVDPDVVKSYNILHAAYNLQNKD